MRWRLVVFTLLSVELNRTGLAQNTGDNEIVTDRPDITESAIVVPTASLQAENGAMWTGGRHATGLADWETRIRLRAKRRRQKNIHVDEEDLSEAALKEHEFVRRFKSV